MRSAGLSRYWQRSDRTGAALVRGRVVQKPVASRQVTHPSRPLAITFFLRHGLQQLDRYRLPIRGLGPNTCGGPSPKTAGPTALYPPRSGLRPRSLTRGLGPVKHPSVGAVMASAKRPMGGLNQQGLDPGGDLIGNHGCHRQKNRPRPALASNSRFTLAHPIGFRQF